MKEENNPKGEFHHFQLVNQQGDIPMSISILIHYNRPELLEDLETAPISTNDIIEFHEAFQKFDGNYGKAFGGR